MAWAGSATSLSSWPCGLALVDERDRMDADVQGEGDPVTLVRARGKNYPRFKLGICSTPTIEDASPIQAHFDDGTMEFWEWCCPALRRVVLAEIEAAHLAARLYCHGGGGARRVSLSGMR